MNGSCSCFLPPAPILDSRGDAVGDGDGGGGAASLLCNSVLSNAKSVFATASTCALTCASGTLLKPGGISKRLGSTVGCNVLHLRYHIGAFHTLNITTGFTEKLGAERQSRIFVDVDKRFRFDFAR